MFPFWDDIPLTVWLQMSALAVAVFGWLSAVSLGQGHRQ